MPSLDDLKKRIKSVKSTQKITKAMKMVAAAKLRKAQENAENIILNLTNSINDPKNAPQLLVGTGQDETNLCVVMTSDRGLCGGFNSSICKLAKIRFKKMVRGCFRS